MLSFHISAEYPPRLPLLYTILQKNVYKIIDNFYFWFFSRFYPKFELLFLSFYTKFIGTITKTNLIFLLKKQIIQTIMIFFVQKKLFFVKILTK